MGDALLEALRERAFDVLPGGVGALGDGLQGAAVGGLVEPGGPGGLGGQLGHLLDASGAEVPALPVLLAQEARVLVAVSAHAHGVGPILEVWPESH